MAAAAWEAAAWGLDPAWGCGIGPGRCFSGSKGNASWDRSLGEGDEALGQLVVSLIDSEYCCRWSSC